MKKLNNKGFAISTILYSLLIMIFIIVALMMGIMASNRRNSKDLITTIEEELNRYSLTTTEFVSTTGSEQAQEYIVPYGKAGWYKIELWGAAGGNSTSAGGKGAYTSGMVYLAENTALYFYIGGQGSGTTGGTNGGGNGNNAGAGGGGATDVRLIPGTWNDAGSLASRIMVAAGGGGANNSLNGQNGGTIEGDFNIDPLYGQGATQTAGGVAGTSASAGALGKGGNAATNGAGGGGGYYGGGGGGAAAPGGGGSSFISGYAGCAVNGDLKVQKHTSGLYFIDGMMSEGANSSAGRAKIELISTGDINNPPTRKNSILQNKVRYIRVCVNSVGSTKPQWTEVQVMSGGVNVAGGKAPAKLTDGKRNEVLSTGTAGTRACQTINLGSQILVDEIAVWHTVNNTDAVSNKVLTNIEVSASSNTTWNASKMLIKSGTTETEKSSPESQNGTHLSAWDQRYIDALPNGTYYIFSSLSPNTGLVAAQNSLLDGNTAQDKFQRLVNLSAIDGSNLQKWTITNVDGTHYKIVERESNQAMQIVDTKGQSGSNINTSSSYHDLYEWTMWKILPLGDGTYRIKPYVQPTAYGYETSLSTSSSAFGATGGSIVLSTDVAGNYSQRFYLVSAE